MKRGFFFGRKAGLARVFSLFSILSLAFSPALRAQSDAPPKLFSEAAFAADVIVQPTVKQRHATRVDFNLLNGARKEGAQLRLNLFPDADFIGIVETVETRKDSDYTITGHLKGIEPSSFVLAVKDGVAIMNLRPGDRELIEVRYLGDGVHDIRKIDERMYPPCETKAEHRVAKKPGGQADGLPQRDSNEIIDVMVVYTPAARAAAGGTTAMENLINLAFTESNTAYQQSLIIPRIRLAHMAEVSYTESTNMGTDLDALTEKTDGTLDNIHALRDTYGADMVCLWVNNPGSCGLAWLMGTLSAGFEDSAFSVVNWDCATGFYSFAHELGHNMGCAHDRENSGGPGLYSYSYGWRFTGTNGSQYRTIMAYAPGTRIQRFSNPGVNYFGTPTGVAVGETGEANNAQTINNSALTIANFRQSVLGTNLSPTITAQPNPQSAGVGGSASFSVTVSGSAPFFYQWRKNGTNVSGATLSSYTINPVQTNHAGTYSVIVTNAAGSVTSSNALLTIILPLSDALDAATFSWTNGGAASWTGQTAVTHDGVDAAQSGSITNLEESWFETAVTGPGVLTYWWKVSSETNFDFVRFYIGGVQQSSLSGEVDWQQKSFNLGNGNQILRWTYAKDESESGGQDKAWVDQVVFTPSAPITLAGSLDNTGLSWTTVGTAWVGQSTNTHDGVDAAVSGSVADNQSSTMQATVVGPATLTYWWKVSSEQDYDFLVFYLNTTSNRISGEVNWTQRTVSIPSGTHTLKWTYSKDSSFNAGLDKGFVDQVVLTAGSSALPSSIIKTENQLQFQFNGTQGASYTIQGSPDLVNWTTITNLTATASPVLFLDPNTTGFDARFYRIVSP